MIEAISADPPTWRERTVLRQRWAELAYFHWPYEPAVVQARLPDGVTVDTFDGRAWVGLIPFEMRDVRVGSTPRVPYLGAFIEVNVRTYVTDQHGRRAVWFWSLDVPRTVVVGVARSVFALPYCWSACTHERPAPDRHRYTVRRRWPDGGATSGSSDISFRVGAEIADDAVDELDHFHSARWGLLTTRRGRVLRGPVDHVRWPLHRVHDVSIDDSLVVAAGLPAPKGEPVARYSPGVAVRVGWPRRTDRMEPR
jgi:uncharacterized protein YqjF (DUF2071 family)